MASAVVLRGEKPSAVKAGLSSEFREGRGCQVEVEGRPIAIFRHNKQLYALDHHCYHAGGPLSEGDIEDLVLTTKIKKGKTAKSEEVNHPCVVCPWHKYKISLTTGEGIYLHADPFATTPQRPKNKSRGPKQRTHLVWEENGYVYVVVGGTDNGGTSIKYDSDYYASEDFQLRMKQK